MEFQKTNKQQQQKKENKKNEQKRNGIPSNEDHAILHAEYWHS